tara:strand:+ start:60 stop:1253 length:1194 start_codon:yes stop_codon:yes gene_type:complete
VPTTYTFASRFESGKSSVSYGGQTVRNLLVQDLKILIGNLGKDGASPIGLQDLLDLYEYDDALNLTSLSTAGSTPVMEPNYSAISTGKNLIGKLSDDVVLGTDDKNADTLLREWFALIVANSQDPEKLGTPAVYTSDEGLDLSQMINKLLLGAVVYHQCTGVYLNGLLERDNTVARKDGKDPYTSMEHGWDEAFGYFGAARDYARYTDDQLAGGADDYSFDSNEDGMIDFKSEYNFGFSRNAGKRDRGGVGVDFTKEIFDAFLEGRTVIVNRGTVADISAQRQIAAEGLEKVIAATAVHYINDTLSDMAKNGTDDENRVKHNKHWAEMKAFTMALQYNPLGRLSTSDLEQLHGFMGEAPLYDAPGTSTYEAQVTALNDAKDVFQSALGFSAANMADW